jgi:prevent-host-death family protein
MNRDEVPLTQLRARAGAVVDECARTKRAVVITRRGRPVAILVPMEQAGLTDLQGVRQARSPSGGWGDWQEPAEDGASAFSQDLDSLTWGRMEELSDEDRAAAVLALSLARRRWE